MVTAAVARAAAKVAVAKVAVVRAEVRVVRVAMVVEAKVAASALDLPEAQVVRVVVKGVVAMVVEGAAEATVVV